MSYCPKCGKENIENDNYCAKCGAKLNQTHLNLKHNTTANQTKRILTNYSNEAKQKLTPLKIGVICLAMIAILVISSIIIFSVINQKKSPIAVDNVNSDSVADLVGSWSYNEDNSEVTSDELIKHITFYSDGKCKVSGFYRSEMGNWSLTDGELFITGNMGGMFLHYKGFACDYYLSETELIIYDNNLEYHYYKD